MSGPIRILAREKQCVGAGDCVSRPMTEEEKIKYGIKEDRKLKKVKITPPEKEKLLEILAEVQGKTKAIMHAAEVFSVSKTTMLKWIKDYGIDFDAEGRVIVKVTEEVLPVHEGTPLVVEIGSNVITHDGEKLFQEAIKEISSKAKLEGTIVITGQEKKEIPKRLGYAEHDIGNATVIYDFRADLVKIVTPENEEMSLDVARAVAEDILDILDQ